MVLIFHSFKGFFRSETNVEDFPGSLLGQGSLLGSLLTFNALEDFQEVFWKTMVESSPMSLLSFQI
ncbi:hypothetical protein F2Q68_00015295 [Brassica cretica]|uniref:Uncharacterized protein n=1 Tax=Brassica cretica TaxID=69181 RepID=A0A8S9HHM6_BRACR|nr:hypothetical protein F2Q68_00015295 [Brassica cretica]